LNPVMERSILTRGFQKLTPSAILQDGVYVYKGSFAVPLASAWIDDRHSAELAEKGDLIGALALAERAATLAPKSASTQLQLANVLAQEKQWTLAREHYQLAQQNLIDQRPDLQQEALGSEIQPGIDTMRTK